jgi:hypothetical protein
MEPKTATFESVWAMIHETQRLMQESKTETAKELKDLNRQIAKTDRIVTKLLESVKNLNKETDGIGRSNGAFAEEYFYSSLEKGKMKLFGEKFDDIEKNLKGIEPGYKAEYDIVLFNGKSIGIV